MCIQADTLRELLHDSPEPTVDPFRISCSVRATRVALVVLVDHQHIPHPQGVLKRIGLLRYCLRSIGFPSARSWVIFEIDELPHVRWGIP